MKIFLWVILILFCIYLICCIVPPLFKKKKVKNPKEMWKDSEATTYTQRVLCIDDNRQALLWRLRIISLAKKELIFVSYNLRDEESGTDVMSALVDASNRGVRIKILIDGLSGFLDLSHSDNFKSLSKLPNVEIRYYNPINFLFPIRGNYRMHDKYVIADNKVFILGGRNTKNLSLGDYQLRKDYDRDLVVYNTSSENCGALGELKEYFETIWNYSHTKEYRPGRIKDTDAIEKLKLHYDKILEEHKSDILSFDLIAETAIAKRVHLMSNPCVAGNKEPVLLSNIFSLFKDAKDIIIQTPYIICDRYMHESIRELVDYGKKIQFLTNSVNTGANTWGCADYLNHKRRISKMGGTVYDYVGDRSCHTKSVIIDRDISLVGSFNFDMRSAYIDTELMLFVDCPELNEHLRKICEDNMRQSICHSPAGSITYGENYNEIIPSNIRRTVLDLLRLIEAPFRHLL